MKSLKVIFFGTPEFAKNSLEAIHLSHHEVVAVVTAPDKASGRGQKISQSAVKIYAEEQNIPVLQPEKLRNEEFLEEIKNLNADIFVVVAFRMMPKVLFQIPSKGTFNLHASLLPQYRGAAPINFAIINGEVETGATTFFINEKIDEGNILLQDKLSIGTNENAGELHDRLMVLGGKLVVKTLDGISEDSISEKPQPEVENVRNAYKIFKEQTQIDWNQNSKTVHQFILGMSPYPAAFTNIKINDEIKSLKIFGGKYDIEEHQEEVGSLKISKHEFFFYTKDGTYAPESVQLQGKKRMSVKDFLNGFQSFENIAAL